MFGSAIVLRVIPYLVAAGVAFGAGWTINGWRLGIVIAQKEEAHAKAIAAAELASRTKEQGLQKAADQIRREKDARINTINSALNSAIDSLRQRDERPSPYTLSPNPSVGLVAKGCTGAELYRSDAEFLIREAARADTVKQSYEQCYAQYQAVKKILED